MLGFNGGLMGVRRTPTDAAASGLWFHNEQSVAQRAGVWPIPAGPKDARYFRLANFANTALNSNTLDFGEIELYDQETKHTGITCTTNITWTSGQDSFLVDGTPEATRSYTQEWSGIQSTATITLDLGSTKTVSHIKIFSLFQQPRFPASFDLQKSADNVTYQTVATVIVGTSFTYVSGATYASNKVGI